VSQNRADLPRPAWRDFFELLTKEHEGDDVTIEVVSLDFGDQLEAEKLPLAYIEYDDKDDVFIVAVGGRDGRYPAVLRHMIAHPKTIMVDSPAPNVTMAIDVVGGDGAQTLVTLHRRPALPS
jgi:hypothetical protein